MRCARAPDQRRLRANRLSPRCHLNLTDTESHGWCDGPSGAGELIFSGTRCGQCPESSFRIRRSHSSLRRNHGRQWTEAKKRGIRDSRVVSTRYLAEALAEAILGRDYFYLRLRHRILRKPRRRNSRRRESIRERLSAGSLPANGKPRPSPQRHAGIRAVNPRFGWC